MREAEGGGGGGGAGGHIRFPQSPQIECPGKDSRENGVLFCSLFRILGGDDPISTWGRLGIGECKWLQEGGMDELSQDSHVSS